MIVSSLRRIAPKTAHDHETASRRAQAGREQGCATPVQPRRRSTAATSAAVWHRRSPRSARPNLSVTMPSDRVGVVAALVAPLLVSGMRRGPVEFRAHPVLLVEVVEVLVAGTLPDPRLPTSGGQARAGVPPGERSGIPAATRRHPRRRRAPRKLPAPAHLLAGVHGLAYPVGGGAPAADGPADPRIRVVEGRRDLDQVEHRVLDPGAWREHGRVPGPQDRVRPVDDDARNLRPRRTSSTPGP